MYLCAALGQRIVRCLVPAAHVQPAICLQINNNVAGQNRVSQPLSDIPAGSTGEGLFLSERSPWFTSLEEVCYCTHHQTTAC